MEFVGSRWEPTGGAAGLVGSYLSKYGQVTAAILGTSLGFYKWWHYREAILHRRLEEYLSHQDQRLASARQDMLVALQRPSPGNRFDKHIFVEPELSRVLRERRWDVDTYGDWVARGAVLDLRQASDKLLGRIKASEDKLKNLREQLATASLLDGAVTAARKPSLIRNEDPMRLQRDALAKFRSVQEFPGHSGDLLAKELEAHQYRRLGDFTDALDAYNQLECLAEQQLRDSQRDLLVARSRFYRAAILQAQTLRSYLDGGGGVNGGSHGANGLLDQSQCLFSLHKPHHEWDLIDLGRIHYLRALVYNRLEFGIQQNAQLDLAEHCFRTVISELPRRFIVRPEAERRIWKEADFGLKAIEYGRAGDYLFGWLLPLTEVEVAALNGKLPADNPLHNPQQPAHPVSAAGGDEGIQKTA